MKRYTIAMAVILILGNVTYMQFGRDMTVQNIFRFSRTSDYSESMDVVLNRLVIIDEEECAQEILQKYLDNDLGSILLRGDSGQLQELQVKVYLSKRAAKKGNCAMQFCGRRKKASEDAGDLSAFELEIK